MFLLAESMYTIYRTANYLIRIINAVNESSNLPLYSGRCKSTVVNQFDSDQGGKRKSS